jgi:hypothetical protein
MGKAQIEQLIAKIQKAFPLDPVPASVAECPCPQCCDLQSAFYGRQWRSVSAETVEPKFDKLPLLHPLRSVITFPRI